MNPPPETLTQFERKGGPEGQEDIHLILVRPTSSGLGHIKGHGTVQYGDINLGPDPDQAEQILETMLADLRAWRKEQANG